MDSLKEYLIKNVSKDKNFVEKLAIENWVREISWVISDKVSKNKNFRGQLKSLIALGEIAFLENKDIIIYGVSLFKEKLKVEGMIK